MAVVLVVALVVLAALGVAAVVYLGSSEPNEDYLTYRGKRVTYKGSDVTLD
ncbi:MAG: hypothetical protein LC687_07680 [Actinobacteria bacterium]|nr:hypothetical protein [Actinomycetota bacterium]